MDRFMEMVVSKHNRKMEEALYYLSFVVMIFTGLMALLYFATLTSNFVTSLVMLLIFGGMTAYLYFTRDKLRTEYEYTFTNGSLDFAMIFNNRRRKNLGTLNVATVDAFGRVSSGSFRRHTASPDVKHLRWFLNRGEELYYFAFSKDGKKSVIVFEPNAELVGHIKHYLPVGAHQEN